MTANQNPVARALFLEFIDLQRATEIAGNRRLRMSLDAIDQSVIDDFHAALARETAKRAELEAIGWEFR